MKFKAWMRTDQGEFELSRPYYKTYYDYNHEYMQERHFYLMFLLGVYAVCYAKKRWELENARWHTHVRRTQIKDLPAHHFTNHGGVLVKKEFLGFNKYVTDGEEQMEWLKQAYPHIYNEKQ